MKLFRFGPIGSERAGFIDAAGVARDVSAAISDYDERFFAEGGLAHLKLLSSRPEHFPQVTLDDVRLGSPVARPSKIIGIGLNYAEHAQETGSTVPSEPKIFMKASSALCGVNDELLLPRGSTCTDYEVEMACVIGRRANYVDESDAWDFVAGFTVCNDYSEREFQKNRSGQFVKGKSADTFAPLGPFLVTADESKFERARLWCSVNGEMRQDATTAQMIFKVPQLVACLSRYMSLLPGDVITTGTPSGVGLGRNPPLYLASGDVVEYGIEGIGQGRQQVVGPKMS